MTTETSTDKPFDWLKASKDFLEGRTIQFVRYLTEEEAEDMGWTYRPIVMFLDNGEYCFPMADDEGNEGGALATSDEQLQTIPVFY